MDQPDVIGSIANYKRDATFSQLTRLSKKLVKYAGRLLRKSM